MSRKVDAWMIVYPGCEVGPCETMEDIALMRAIRSETPGTAVVPLVRWPEAAAFFYGDPVEKFTGEARWEGVIVSAYQTTAGKLRYVVEVKPQGFQMIAVPEQLRARSARPEPFNHREPGEFGEGATMVSAAVQPDVFEFAGKRYQRTAEEHCSWSGRPVRVIKPLGPVDARRAPEAG